MEMPAVTHTPVRETNSPTTRSWWGDRGVKTKVLAAVGVAALVAVVIGVMGISALSSSAESNRMLYVSNIGGLTAAADMRTAIADVRIATRNAVLEPDPAKAGQILDSIPGLEEQYRAAHDAYNAAFPIPETEALNEEALTNFEAYLKIAATELRPLAEQNRYLEWYALNQEKNVPLTSAATAALDKMREIETGLAQEAAAAAQDQFQSQRTTSIVVLVVGIATAVGVGLVVATGMARGVGRVQRVAEALAAGDLTKSSGLATRDELGRMGAALDGAVENLREVLGTVASSADAVAASSEELSASSAQISASAEETSAQAGVVSSAAEEVSRNVQTVAAGAEQMGASIREIASNAAEASEVAAKAVTAAETTTATVAKLGESSAEIGNVVKVITSIA
ncbi:MCP four helix bundle domain-containing protein, partial [Geodermatophilus ruber]